jgi:hypothetical protein
MGGDGKKAENHCNDEDVVDTERLLNNIAGQVFHGGGLTIIDDSIDGQWTNLTRATVPHTHNKRRKKRRGPKLPRLWTT